MLVLGVIGGIFSGWAADLQVEIKSGF